jgi:hypothetical protein
MTHQVTLSWSWSWVGEGAAPDGRTALSGGSGSFRGRIPHLAAHVALSHLNQVG